MGTDTGQQGDTPWSVNLHDHIKAMMDERDRRYEALSAAQKDAVEAALKAAQLAVDKAEAIAEKWRLNANEWRSAMSDKDRQYLTKDVAKGYFILGLMASGVIVAIVELVIRLAFHRP